jgi:hypothetical protein
MKQIKMNKFTASNRRITSTILLLISLALMMSMSMQHRYLVEEYDEDYEYVSIKQQTNAGARSDKKFPPVSQNYKFS